MKMGKPGKPDKKPGGDQTELLLRIIDVQSRVIDSLAMALGATVEKGSDEDEDDSEKESEEE